MMETSLRSGVVEKIMNGEESNFLPQFVIDKMLASVPLRGLIHAVAQNGSSAYDDGDDDSDEDGKVEANCGDQARCTQPTGDELLEVFEDALPAGNKRATFGEGKRVTCGGAKGQVEFFHSFDIRVYNKTLRIYAGIFFGLMSEDRKGHREYACVTHCFSYKQGNFVRLEIYSKSSLLCVKSNVARKVRQLELPGLKRYPKRRFTIRNAAQLKYPLHVLHACPRKSSECSQSFGIGIQGGGDHNVAKYPQYVLNTYHVGSVNF
jgi:hypothetical protein